MRPRCHIIPPHVLRHIAEKGNPKQRARALDALDEDGRFRGRREAFAESAAGAVAGTKRRTIYDARRATTLPGTLVRGEGTPATGDAAVDEAYDGSGATYDLFLQLYERNSIDDQGLRLDSTVHYGQEYANAFWDGRQMVYGDGDNDLFQRFTACIDVIGHELTHGVTQYEAALAYRNEPGALNESMSDVFGSLVKQRALGHTAAQADWLIGAGLFTGKVQGVALRSMKAPGTAYDDPVLGKDPQPAHMKEYVKVSYDNGGVHINSGVPNHAFYLAATALGGMAWEKAGRIWYIALRDRLRRTSDFARAAQATVSVAGELFGANGAEQRAVRQAWADVGVVVK